MDETPNLWTETTERRLGEGVRSPVERLTPEQAVIITAYTGVLCCPFGVFHIYAERVIGRSIWTHEFANPELWAALKLRTKSEFIAICAESKEPAGENMAGVRRVRL